MVWNVKKRYSPRETNTVKWLFIRLIKYIISHQPAKLSTTMAFKNILKLFWRCANIKSDILKLVFKSIYVTSKLGLRIVRAPTFFHFNVFWKTLNILCQCQVPSITKKVTSYSLVLGQQPHIALELRNFH